MRFLAASAVLLFHLTYLAWVQPAGHAERAFGEAFSASTALTRWGWVGVQIFVLSGFVIAFSAQGRTALAFAGARFYRLYPAAWLCALLTFGIAGASSGELIRSLVLWPVGPWVDGVYWTLAVEIMFYLAVILAIRAGMPVVTLGVAIGFASTA